MKKLILLSFLVIGCAQAPELKPRLEIEPRLQEYIELFEIESINHKHPIQITNLVARFGSTTYLGEDVIGYCQLSYPPLVVIDLEFWEGAELMERENLMFHELGHCVLNKDHNDELTNGFPSSIMNSCLMDSRMYELNRDFYLFELFLM